MELDEVTMGVIGIMAGILILSGWVPQIAKGYRSKKLDDVYIMGVNIAAMVLTMIVLSMKLKYEKAAQATSE